MRISRLVIVFILMSMFTSLGIPGPSGVQGVSAQPRVFAEVSGATVEQDFLLALKSPTLLPIDNADGDGSYLVSWTTVPSATSYTLEQDDNPGFTSPVTRYFGADTQYQVNGQYYGTWYYRVMASNASSNSLWSNTELVMVINAPPNAPVLEPITNPDGDGTYLVDWNSVTGTLTYTLEEDDNSSFSSPSISYTGTITQHVVTGQLAGTWYYRVLASNGDGDSPWSNTQLVNVKPSAPVLSAIDNPDGDGNFTIQWSSVTGAISYTLEEDDNDSFGSPKILYQGNNNQFPLTGQYYGTWYYRVMASNAGGKSPWSNTELVVVINAPPAAPVLEPITNPDGDGTYLVDWNSVTGTLTYTLEQDDNSSFSSPSISYTGTITQHVVTGQLAGTWYYRVLASNADGDSPWSNIEVVNVKPSAPVLSPIDNTDGDGNFTIQWSSVTGAISYTLEEDDNSSFNSPSISYTGTITQHVVTGQLAGTWHYRVLASNAGGDSPWSNGQMVSVKPAAPTLSPIDNTDGDGNYNVQWSSVTGAISYTLEEDDNSGFSSPSISYTGTITQHVVIGQPAGTWYYRVQASNAGGDSLWSNTQLVNVMVAPPASPILAPISNPDGDGGYNIEWSTVTGAISYTLEEDDNSSFSSPSISYTGTITQHVVTGQLAGTWYYRVMASNAGGNSPWSNIEVVNVRPDEPELLPISNPDWNGDYLVDWNEVAGATGYRLQEDDDPGFGTPLDRYTGPASQLDIAGQAGGTWYYRVLAINVAGDSLWSNVESTGVMPAAPSLLPIVNPDGDGDYLIDWSNVGGADSFLLEEADNSDFITPTVRYEGAASEFQVTGQATGMWYYRVQASNTYGESPWSNSETAGVVPGVPVLSSIENGDGDGDYQVGWTEVVSATSYRLQEDDNAEFTSPRVVYEGAQNGYAVTGQYYGSWYYRVLASNAGGESGWSNVEWVTVEDAPPESPVLAGISNPDGNGDYLVDWNEVGGATSYRLEEADNSSFNLPTVRYEGSLTELEVSRQPSGTWYYRVLASNAGGDSPWSNVETASVIPAAPVLLPIENADGNGDYLVDWNEMVGATGYRLQEDDNPGFTTPVDRYTGSASQFEATSQSGGNWYYRVLASNPAGESPWSNTQSVNVILVPQMKNIYMPLVSRPTPDGVNILSSTYSYEYSDNLYIIGEVFNNTDRALAWVKVKVNLFNAGGQWLADETTYPFPFDLPAKQKGCFIVSMQIPPGWSYYKFDAPQYWLGDSNTSLTIHDTSGAYDAGSYSLFGQIWNDGNQIASNVYVSGTLYNNSGLPVGCQYAFVKQSMAPGEASLFKINFPGYIRDYNDVTRYRLRVVGDLP